MTDLAYAIVKAVANEHQINVWVLMGTSRVHTIAHARQEAMLRVRERLGWSYPRLGKYFSRDHSTVWYGCAQARQRRGDKRQARGAA